MNKKYESEKLLKQVNQHFEKAVCESAHSFHHFSFGTINNQNVEQRTVILRRWALKQRTIMFYSDIRSPKIMQLRQHPICSALFYSKDDKLQCRFDCIAHVHHNTCLSKHLFNQTTHLQRDCYRTVQPPSSPIDLNKNKFKANPQDNFAVVICKFNRLDVLFLDRSNHRRYQYLWDQYNNLNTMQLVV